MKAIKYTSRFKKDVKRLKKGGKDFTDFKKVIEQLARGETLASKYRDHKLLGAYVDTKECHIAPGWLLIYEASPAELVLIRSGSHALLFE